ncbi:YihY/virulence factor BrkB family protein [Aquimarina sp. ERC-38]|uniref:YihY/virulence factor BrkB family protein n=1 Tax=Aquimarina sp. ERC-38 TaxID=2949996 RepID=UPI00224837EE|nr:YihY/virulence factor BrkB family protein [Aquimarina sp. ERC-38]UZO81085.1 YihY/virulence factor BrkB family protein [Aquimarina sp. ERC-38]
MKSEPNKTQRMWAIVKETYTKWMDSDPFQLSAAVSYYALFSFPALVIIVIQTVSIFYSRAEVQDRVMKEITSILGEDSASTIKDIIENAISQDQSYIAIAVGIATLLYGATGMFVALQKSLNAIWGVKPKPKNEYLKMLRDRIFSLGLILVIGFLLLISLVLTAVITALVGWIEYYLPDFMVEVIQLINFFISLGLITILFALIFKYLPDVKIRWNSVWVGAFVTSVLFVLGKSALGIYFGQMDPGSSFGAAGSVILILLWVSYSSIILFFGATFTQVYAAHYGIGIKPASYAERVD